MKPISMKPIKRLFIVLGDQLSMEPLALQNFDKTHDLVWMAEAAEAGDAVTAEILRDAIDRIRSGDSGLVEQRPGHMGADFPVIFGYQNTHGTTSHRTRVDARDHLPPV